jgi:hypothetical protein
MTARRSNAPAGGKGGRYPPLPGAPFPGTVYRLASAPI